MRAALLFQHGNFVGREYLAALVAAGRTPDLVVSVGAMTSQSVAREVERTGGLWNPPAIPPHIPVHVFTGLNDPTLWSLLRQHDIDVAIQGGVGILKADMIAVPKIGFLNVHPGRLPQYRGNACPEWALLNGDEVCATAHMIDAGIDTGPVVTAMRYEIDPNWSYAAFRAHLYAHCARVLCSALDILDAAGRSGIATVLHRQDESFARYWPALDDEAERRVLELFARSAGATGAPNAG